MGCWMKTLTQVSQHLIELLCIYDPMDSQQTVASLAICGRCWLIKMLHCDCMHANLWIKRVYLHSSPQRSIFTLQTAKIYFSPTLFMLASDTPLPRPRIDTVNSSPSFEDVPYLWSSFQWKRFVVYCICCWPFLSRIHLCTLKINPFTAFRKRLNIRSSMGMRPSTSKK